MKKILFLLLFIPSMCWGQSPLRLPYPYILHVYQSDTIKQMFRGDTAKWYTDKANFSFNKPIFVNGVQLGSGGTANIYAKDGVHKHGDTIKLSKDIFIPTDSTFQIFMNNQQTFSTNNDETYISSPSGVSAIILDDITSRTYINGYILSVSSGASTVIAEFKPGSEITKAYIDSLGKITAYGGGQFGTNTNNSTFESDGTLTFNGNATVYDDLLFPFSTGKQGTTDYPAFNADSMYYSFSVDTTAPSVCMMYFTVQMPHSWKEGTTIYPHVHYKHETAVGTPTFKMKYKWYPLEGSTETGYKWYTMGTTTGTTDKTNQMVYGSGGISGTGKGISSILICAVYLSGQTGTGAVNAYQFDIHYEKDTIGSRTTTSK